MTDRATATDLVSPRSDEPCDVTVVILTWNDQALMDRAVASVLDSRGVRPEIVVVDNGSQPPASVPAGVRLIRNPTNVGVSRARNQGVAATTADFVCFLDSDAVLEPTTLRRLVDPLLADASVGVTAPVFRGQPPEASAGTAPGLGRKLARGVGLTDRYRSTRSRWLGHREVDFAIGACQVIRRSAFVAVGGLDETYFYGPEDVDLCLRLRTKGWRVLQVEDAICEHRARRRHRRLLTPAGFRHTIAVGRYLWLHRHYRRVT
jgi:N-acetylglucosaminyl-diphospho-decaprenol L-rhamnosyltransferase